MGLKASGLTLGYGGRPVLGGVDLDASAGEVVSVVGPNGSGKTTLLRALAGTLAPLDGHIAVNGVPLDSLRPRERARQIGFVPQSRPLEFAFTVREVVEMGRTAYLSGLGTLSRDDDKAVERALGRVGLQELAAREATSLSAGQAQLMLLARALAQDPEILLLDEPTAHLDLTHQIEIMEMLRALVRQQKLAAVAVLHDLNLAATYCDRIMVLSKGRVRAVGSPGEVLTRGVIREAFGVDVLVRRHPASGACFVVPLAVSGPPEPLEPRSHLARVHIICGGGTGARLMSELARAGFEVTVGVVNVLDDDFEVAQALGLHAVAEAPFSPVTAASLEEARSLVRSCDAAVLADVPFGPANLANLELAEEALRTGKLVVVLAPEGAARRDFAGGASASRIRALVVSGARTAHSLEGALSALRGLRAAAPEGEREPHKEPATSGGS